MGRNLDPKCKQCRREGVKLFLRGERCLGSKCAMVKRDYPPGLHGVKRQSRPSGYGLQLREKQKAKRIYGMLEKQFRGLYQKASNKKGDTGEIFLQLLESRFDNVVYKLGLGKSRQSARQLINHGHFKVNGKPVNIPSYQVKINDQISVKDNKIQNKFFKEIQKGLDKVDIPKWLHLDKKAMSGKVISLPSKEDLTQDIDAYLIVEFYSR
ncbi:MAG: 30S ribosomal protein S4 [Patescibacteria group bacterium]